MALVRYTDGPRATDTVLLEVVTTDASGCPADPYKVDRVTVYFVERDFLGQNYGEYAKTHTPDALKAELATAQAALCADPSAVNLTAVRRVLGEIEASAQTTTFYFKDRVVAALVGDPATPAWLSTDTPGSPLARTGTGTFTYEWTPAGAAREGDYFLCWTWSPQPDGEKLSAHDQFALRGDPAATAAVPTHATAPGKYETLLERYLPEMYKQYLADADETPDTLDSFNKAVASGFTVVEDMANQIIDLFDANALHESLLAYLSNLFAVKLKGDDPTLWRRQIKQAVPLFKRKGTLGGLREAFAQAGMTLHAFTPYWQVVSPYTWVESFLVTDATTFALAKPTVVTPLDPDHTGVWLMRAGEDEYAAVPSSYVAFDTAADGAARVAWVADHLSAGPVELAPGDRVKVMYQYAEIPGPTEEQVEEYVQLLPLADQRDEAARDYPPKNWNVRLIAEADPLFPVLVPVRHPFADPLVFGFLRTEFAYSENIYNMEEYNGSTRPSLDPCRIDKGFVDPCGACAGSAYSVDIGVAELSNDRMREAQDILREFVPFHAQAHTLNFAGEVNEFVLPPVEAVEFLIAIDREQTVLSGQSNPIFHRFMEGGVHHPQVLRSQLADEFTALAGAAAVAYNAHVAFVAPDVDLPSLGLISTSHVLEVLAPSANAGTYQIDDYAGRAARVKTPVAEPVDGSAFTFALSNVPYGNSYTAITPDNEVRLADPEGDFLALGVKSRWDAVNTPDYAGGPWRVSLPAYSPAPYEIIKATDGVVYLAGDGLLPTADTTGVSYTLLDDADEEVASGTTGELGVTKRGYVELNDTALVDVGEFVRLGDTLYYAGDEYPVLEFDGNNFWVGEYDAGGVAGVSVQIRRRLVAAGLGYFGYRGLRLTTADDIEADFGIINGRNPPPENDQTDDGHFKENFLFLIGGEYYKIADINGTAVTLAGREQDWTTLDAGGTAVTYSLIHIAPKQVDVGFTVFDGLDRNGKDVIIRELFSTVDNNTAIVALSTAPGGGVDEHATQDEGITFTIQTRTGETTEGEL
jgi:hypothetical protein